MAVFATKEKKIFLALLTFASYATSAPEAKCGQSLDPTGKNSGPKSVVVFASRKISKGARIVEDDLREMVINSRGLREADIPIRKSLIDRRPRFEIAQGQVIFEHDLMQRRAKLRSSIKLRKYLTKFIEARKHISEGATITRSDLFVGSVRTSDSSKWLSQIEQAVGMQARSDIVRGQLITTDALMGKSILQNQKTSK